ncbi:MULTISPECIES: beta-propeller fold lactonase family protein [unclassified Amycolatopsis]|uniref:lactonase family protein n=1 Tax=unclassified Amycolatopsis TaxID=2618356 RepID=UPI002875D7A5|nr:MULTISPECIES: beta-propeller fold lactonase family protein [unclassified Amycolatopsis]MDS0133986.1 lactonase family protein [Amycolatopsis sp. 505]MDS0144862.1 lactonase family protein [Amycolatopsis sp. CM201R]
MAELVFVGCYTGDAGNGTGITTLSRSPSGSLREVASLPLESPSWLVRHPSLPVLYAANETADGGVTALAIAPSGELSLLGTAESGGAHPCHLAVTPDGRFLLCANYTGGSVAVFSLSSSGAVEARTALVRHSGSGPVTDRQEAAHVHMAVPSTDGSIVSAVDLGTDEIRSYTLTSSGALEPLAVSSLPPGTGPRQLVRRPGTDLAYVVGELAGTLVTVREKAPGAFEVVASTPSTLSSVKPNLVAHLELADSRLYVSNRGPDCVTEFALDDAAAVADQPCGANPRHFALVDGTCYVAAQSEDAITAFTLTASGEAELRYHPTGSPTFVLPVSLP